MLDPAHLPRAPDFALERLAIVNGTILGRERVDGLDVTASLADAAGPAHAAGGLSLRGARFGFELDIDRIAERMPFRLALAMPASAHLLLTGEASMPAGGAPTLAGKAKLTGDDFAAFARLVQRPVPAALARPFTATATVAGGGSELRLDALDFVLDDLHATGALRLAAPSSVAPASLTLTLALNQLDLDRLASAPPAAEPAGAAAPFAPVLPPDLGGRLDLTVGALRWHGGIVRDARLQATLDHGAIDIPRLVAVLPGGSGLSLNGKLEAASGQRQFRGAVELDSDNLRQLLDWLGAKTAAIPADRLRKLTLTSQFTALSDRIDIGGVDLTVDATRLTGAATVALHQRLAIGARLAIDQLNLDAYLPPAHVPGAAAGPPPQAAPQDPPPGPSGYALLLAAFDANIDATIDTLTWRGQPARGTHLAATLRDGALTLHDATIADIAGASATASGAVASSGGEPAWHAAIALQGPEIAHFVRLVAPDSALGALLSGPFAAKSDIAGERGGVAVDLDLAALGGRARITGEIADSAAAPGLDLGLEISHPSFAALVRNLVPGYQPAGDDPGAVKLAGRLSETKGLVSARDMAIAIGGFTIEGDTIFEQRGGRRPTEADRRSPLRRARARQVSAAPPDRGAGTLSGSAALAGAGRCDTASRGRAAMVARAPGPRGARRHRQRHLADRRCPVLGQMAGRAAGRGGGARQRAAPSRPAVGRPLRRHDRGQRTARRRRRPGQARHRRAPRRARAGAARDRRAADLVAHLQGSLTLASRDGTIAGIDLPAISARLSDTSRATDLPGLLRGPSGGRTRYRSLDGTFRIADGIARSDDLRLVAEAAEGRADTTLDLPKWQIRSRLELRLTEPAAAPPLAMTLDGSLDAPRIVFDINALESYLVQRGSGRLTARPANPEPASPPPPARPTLRDPLTNPVR